MQKKELPEKNSRAIYIKENSTENSGITSILVVLCVIPFPLFFGYFRRFASAVYLTQSDHSAVSINRSRRRALLHIGYHLIENC